MNLMQMQRIEEEIKSNHKNIMGIVVQEKSNVIYENYLNGSNKENTIHIASVTKSITSILIGIAIDKGYIKSVNQKVLEFFPDYKTKRGEHTIQDICIKDLLTMTAPYKYKSEPYTKVFTSNDWTKASLDLLGGKGQIGDFKYSTIGTHILTGIIGKATGMTVRFFADKFLFEPLGILCPDNRSIINKEDYMSFLKGLTTSGWVADNQAVNTGGWGIALKTEDLVKIGSLYLYEGKCNGKQIISSKWIKESTIKHSQMKDLSYGYLWWVIDRIEHAAYTAIGDGGNIIYVCPKEEIVVGITASFKPRAKDRIEFIEEFILKNK